MIEKICGEALRVAPDAHFDLGGHHCSVAEKDIMRSWKKYKYKTVSTAAANNQLVDLKLTSVDKLFVFVHFGLGRHYCSFAENDIIRR